MTDIIQDFKKLDLPTYILMNKVIKLIRSGLPQVFLPRITDAVKNNSVKDFFFTVKGMFNFKPQTAIVTNFKS